MTEKFEVTQVYFPPSLNELLILCKQRPDAVLFSGGTWILRNQRSRHLHLPEAVVSLHTIEEMRRIGRTESRVDIGAAASIKKILSVGRSRLPRILFETLESIAPPGVRGLATLGGNVCVRERSMTSHPTLHILDAKLELRRLGGTRWLPVTSARTPDGVMTIEPGEVLARIRVPIQTWNVQFFRRIGSSPFSTASDSLVFPAVARTHRGVVADLRFAIGSVSPRIYRNRDLETGLVGKKLPLTPRDVAIFIEAIDADLKKTMPELTPFLRDRSISFLKMLLSNLPAD